MLEPVDLIAKLPDLRSAEGILDHSEPVQIQIVRLILAEDLERSILACRQERWVLARATELHGRVLRQSRVVVSSRRRLVAGGPACGSVETEALPQHVRPLLEAARDVVARVDLAKDGWVAPHQPSVPQMAVEDHSCPFFATMCTSSAPAASFSSKISFFSLAPSSGSPECVRLPAHFPGRRSSW